MSEESIEDVSSAGSDPGFAEARFRGAQDVQLYERRWEIAEAKAGLLIVHGFGEHCARYDSIARILNHERYSVYSYDHRGHGQSPGAMGYIPSFDTLVEDLHLFVQHVTALVGEKPLFIWGHSMGGLALALYTVRHRPEAKGLVFSGAGVKMGDDVAPLMQKLSGILSTIAPRLPVFELDANAISRIPEEVEKYVKDPLVYHGKIQARTGHEMIQATKEVQKRMGEIEIPFLALHGTEDHLVKYDASQLLYDQASSEDKSLILYEGAFHEVHNDLDRERFLKDMIEWLDAHCPA